jgi:hypothetical protein
MRTFLAWLAVGLSFTGNAAAQAPDGQQARTAILLRAITLLRETESRAMEQCNTTNLVAQLPVFDYSKRLETVLEGGISSITWSGGCVDGKRDGAGVLNWRSEQPMGFQSERPLNERVKHTVTATAEGRFVKGRRIGLWCVTNFQSAHSNGQSVPGAPLSGLGCYLTAGDILPITPQYIKQPDGRWLENVLGSPGASTLAAGTLEAQSAKMLADAAVGNTDLKVQVVIESRDLDDLVRGSKIALALSKTPISLKGKRLALVLSSQTVSELERFKRQREALIAASAGLRGEAGAERAKFIRTSSPDRLLINVLKAVRTHADDVQPADDLGLLKDGGFDYALVIDWKSMTRFDQLGKYAKEAWPPQPFPAISGVACDALRGFLINRELKVVKQLPAFPTCQIDMSSATGDQAYMWILATYYANAWGDRPEDTGLATISLGFFKY